MHALHHPRLTPEHPPGFHDRVLHLLPLARPMAGTITLSAAKDGSLVLPFRIIHE
jgi:hypothetical protein